MLEQQRSLLLIIDVQGKLATLMHDTDAYLAHLKIMIQGAKILGLPILWAEQLPDKLGPTVAEIADLMPDLQPIAKYSFSCFGNDQLRQALLASGRNQVLLTGIETHICVYQTALDLLRMQKEAHIVCDAVGSRTTINKALGLDKMKQAGAALTSTETCLFELMQHAHCPGFREVVSLFK